MTWVGERSRRGEIGVESLSPRFDAISEAENKPLRNTIQVFGDTESQEGVNGVVNLIDPHDLH